MIRLRGIDRVLETLLLKAGSRKEGEITDRSTVEKFAEELRQGGGNHVEVDTSDLPGSGRSTWI